MSVNYMVSSSSDCSKYSINRTAVEPPPYGFISQSKSDPISVLIGVLTIVLLVKRVYLDLF